VVSVVVFATAFLIPICVRKTGTGRCHWRAKEAGVGGQAVGGSLSMIERSVSGSCSSLSRSKVSFGHGSSQLLSPSRPQTFQAQTGRRRGSKKYLGRSFRNFRCRSSRTTGLSKRRRMRSKAPLQRQASNLPLSGQCSCSVFETPHGHHTRRSGWWGARRSGIKGESGGSRPPTEDSRGAGCPAVLIPPMRWRVSVSISESLRAKPYHAPE
jgi:hypothetical protein